jgi:uncharacterized membrane protein (Fun14 family)
LRGERLRPFMEKTGATRERRAIPRWKKVMIAGGATILLSGLALRLNESSPGGRAVAPPPGALLDPGPAPRVGSRLVAEPPGEGRPSRGRTGEETTVHLSERLSPFLVHGGLSFFLGLAAGVAVRAVFKLALLIVGVTALVLFGLSHWGVIEPVHWASMEEWLSVKVEEVDRTAAGLKQELLLQIPSAGLAGAGLVTGFKRK